MNFQKILRRLILCEMILTPPTLYISSFEEQYLPPELRSYLNAVANQALNLQDGLILAIGIPCIVLHIGAWIALWCGSRSGRLLYTLVWIVSIPMASIAAPWVTGPIAAGLTSLSDLVPGFILGLLYFSDLRLTYEKHE
jgi:hypothetical protein